MITKVFSASKSGLKSSVTYAWLHCIVSYSIFQHCAPRDRAAHFVLCSYVLFLALPERKDLVDRIEDSTSFETSVRSETGAYYRSFATVPLGVTVLYDFITYMQRKQIYCRNLPQHYSLPCVRANIWCCPAQRQHYPEENLGVST